MITEYFRNYTTLFNMKWLKVMSKIDADVLVGSLLLRHLGQMVSRCAVQIILFLPVETIRLESMKLGMSMKESVPIKLLSRDNDWSIVDIEIGYSSSIV